MATAQQVINVAANEVGYLEKKSNAQLDSKTANAGSANYTKYGKAQGCNGQAWCDAFVDWCFIQAFGTEKAKALLGAFSNYTPTSAQYFKNMGRWYTSPKVGDQIFFHNSTRICHTGLVYAVDGSRVYTIEGNTSGTSGLIANGGGVYKKSYVLGYSQINGYGRPAYDTQPQTTGGVYLFSCKQIQKGSSGPEVLLLQEILKARDFGYYDQNKKFKQLKLDMQFGNNTAYALLAYQNKRKSQGVDLGCDAVCGEKTWKDLIAIK